MRLNLFTYGTLMFPQVMTAVAGQTFGSVPAELPGFARHRLRGVGYPAIVPDPAATTEGLLYLELDPGALRRLDRFEGELYRRVTIRVRLSTGSVARAHAYVLRPGQSSRLSRSTWEPQELAAAGLDRFRLTYGGFRRIRRQSSALMGGSRNRKW